ncbi:hypothetical protein ACFQZW_07060 [Lutibacter aestuarii]|uniref:Uncharacterized protein n=2 Tax=Lutibacter TaxID=358023 RepID=A0ABW2Z4T5_9FLAO
MKTLNITSKKLKLVFIGLFLSTISFSQNYVDSSTLTVEKLAEIFKNAYI